jgi:hypothetical protein
VSGQELYALYVEANARQNCGVDSWDQMADSDQEMWNTLAELVDAREAS